MKVNVTGEKVSKDIALLYANEFVKAHSERKIKSIDIFVEGDFLKIKCIYDDLDAIA